jgi:hypothetical protein
MVSISGKPDLSADGADRVIAAAEPQPAALRLREAHVPRTFSR